MIHTYVYTFAYISKNRVWPSAQAVFPLMFRGYEYRAFKTYVVVSHHIVAALNKHCTVSMPWYCWLGTTKSFWLSSHGYLRETKVHSVKAHPPWHFNWQA